MSYLKHNPIQRDCSIRTSKLAAAVAVAASVWILAVNCMASKELDPTEILLMETTKPEPAKKQQNELTQQRHLEALLEDIASETPKAELKKTTLPKPNLSVSSVAEKMDIVRVPAVDIRKIWEDLIEYPGLGADQSADSELNKMIDKVNRMKVTKPQEEKTLEQRITEELPPISSSVEEKTTSETITPIEEKPLFVPIDEKTIQLLSEENSQTVTSAYALELAELFYKSQQFEKAAQFYRKAMEHNSSDSPLGTSNRAWILFQLGNCYEKNDPEQAASYYRQLVSEHPQSFWSEVAMRKVDVIEWTENNDLETLTNQKDVLESTGG